VKKFGTGTIVLLMVLIGNRSFSEVSTKPHQRLFNKTYSMLPTLHIDDQIFADVDAYKSVTPSRGDLVAFELPSDPSVVFVKRVVGLPGDTLVIEGKTLLINGKKIERKTRRVSDIPGLQDELDSLPKKVPKSFPKKLTFEVEEEFIDGKSHFLLFEKEPTRPRVGLKNPIKIPPGQYFILGDYRDNSNDSRYWGFVPLNNIVGKADHIFASRNSKRIGLQVK
jgi:signal peptidase I